jgi:hypothetical protein
MSTIISSGRSVEILNLTLSSTNDIQVGFTKPVNTVILKARTAVDIQVRASNGAGNYYTIPSGSALTLYLSGVAKDGTVQPTNLWIRSVSATPVVEVIGVYGG